jgi:hypothetical protein
MLRREPPNFILILLAYLIVSSAPVLIYHKSSLPSTPLGNRFRLRAESKTNALSIA